jgi:hypothetical protein
MPQRASDATVPCRYAIPDARGSVMERTSTQRDACPCGGTRVREMRRALYSGRIIRTPRRSSSGRRLERTFRKGGTMPPDEGASWHEPRQYKLSGFHLPRGLCLRDGMWCYLGARGLVYAPQNAGLCTRNTAVRARSIVHDNAVLRQLWLETHYPLRSDPSCHLSESSSRATAWTPVWRFVLRRRQTSREMMGRRQYRGLSASVGGGCS